MQVHKGMDVAERIVADSQYSNYTHPLGTQMRMMVSALPFKLSFKRTQPV